MGCRVHNFYCASIRAVYGRLELVKLLRHQRIESLTLKNFETMHQSLIYNVLYPPSSLIKYRHLYKFSKKRVIKSMFMTCCVDQHLWAGFEREEPRLSRNSMRQPTVTRKWELWDVYRRYAAQGTFIFGSRCAVLETDDQTP